MSIIGNLEGYSLREHESGGPSILDSGPLKRQGTTSIVPLITT